MAAQNGTRNGVGGKGAVPAVATDDLDLEEVGADRANSPPPMPGYAAQNRTAHCDEVECESIALPRPAVPPEASPSTPSPPGLPAFVSVCSGGASKERERESESHVAVVGPC